MDSPESWVVMEQKAGMGQQAGFGQQAGMGQWAGMRQQTGMGQQAGRVGQVSRGDMWAPRQTFEEGHPRNGLPGWIL